MNHISTIRVIGAIIIIAVGWAVLANWLINLLSEKFEPGYLNLFRILNSSLVVIMVLTAMYLLIKKQRQRLRVAGEYYGRLFENIPAPMFIYDADTYKFLTVNKAAELQYGYTKEEFLTLSPANLRLRGKLKSFYNNNDLANAKHFQTAYWLHEDKFGNSFYVRVYTCDTVFNGKPAKQAMVINIDDMVKTELALIEDRAELEKLKSEIKNTPIPYLA